MKKTLKTSVLLALGMVPGIILAAGNTPDFGALIQNHLRDYSFNYFGFWSPVATSAVDPNGASPSRTPSDLASDQVKVAAGLTVTYLTREAANLSDMMAFWPLGANPTHLITCVEGAVETLADGRKNPSVQRIELATGKVETVLRGMSRCDGIVTTPWGTILATEETAGGGAYEILYPLVTTNVTVTARNTQNFVDANGQPVTNRVAWRDALASLAWEGLHAYPNGTVYFGDELRPGTNGADTDGGALYKFVPAVPRNPASGLIQNLDKSPLAAGTNYAMKIGCTSGASQVGQGCEVGSGVWVAIDNPRNATAEADAKGATGYYRPEDLHGDPRYRDPANPNAIRVCWTNTGSASIANYGEVVCAVDKDSGNPTSTVTANRFIEGDTQLNQPDNLAFQPVTGNVYVIEDNDNGDVWACLRDGADRDIKSDGCVRTLSVVDQSAEPTGFLFTPDGTRAIVTIQHSDDTNMPKVDGYDTDDIVIISGFNTNK